MISISSAERIIRRQTGAGPAERIAIFDAVGRILAEDVIADTDLPPFNRSQMDGYAVIASDTANAPAELRIIGESSAGHGWDGRVRRGESVRIMTGARVPKGADAVQRVERTSESGGTVTIKEAVAKRTSIVPKGSEVRKGRRVLRIGDRITPNNISAAAAFGYAKVLVGRRPRVAILSTGDEIVEIATKPKPDQIRNSNSVMLKALAEAAGAECELLAKAGDDLASIKQQIKAASRKKDVLLTTGGVSVGKYDLTKVALHELGAEVFFEKLRLKPGKPMIFARLGKMLIFALPGNPVSATVTYQLFVRPALLRMQGVRSSGLEWATAVAAKRVKAAVGRDTFVNARLSTDEKGTLIATPLRTSGSSDLVGYSAAEALIFAPADSVIEAGEAARIVFV
ncbi:MAG: molybdopterin molybdotransferase MoeA [Chloracidobacterium sp.]|nr:molybdopterin molybdotransferase MoeA [Chloracidobacterium sp.]MCO5332788.1 molybdopterin molybdotransferase MoeA [Pyrinomonadaceae bacterium]